MAEHRFTLTSRTVRVTLPMSADNDAENLATKEAFERTLDHWFRGMQLGTENFARQHRVDVKLEVDG